MALKKGRVKHLYDFSYGVNCKDPGYLIDDRQCYARVSTYDGTVNVYWDKGIRRRGGTSKVNSSASGDKLVNGHRHYRSDAPVKTTFVGADNGSNVLIQYESGGSLTTVSGGSAIASGNEVHFASWKDALFVASGNQVIQVITYSGGWSRADISGLAYKPQYVCAHRDRLWAGGGDMPLGYFECSAYDDYTDWSGGDGEAFYAGRQDGDPLTGLVPRGDDLVIYKNDSIWLMKGDNLYNWFEQTQNKAIGCCAPKSIAECGFGHFFLSNDNVYFFDGVNDPVPVGDPIKPWLDAIPVTLRKLAAGTYYNNYYRLAFATSNESEKNDFEVILDLRMFKQGIVAWWPNNSRYIAGYIPYVGPDDDQDLYFADGSAGYLRKIDSGNQDDTTNIRAEFHSKYFVLGQPNREKEYGICKLDNTQGIGTFTLNLIRNLNDAYTLAESIDASGGGDSYGSAVLGTTYWTSQENARMTSEIALPPELDGYAISAEIIHEGNYGNVIFYGFSLEAALKRF